MKKNNRYISIFTKSVLAFLLLGLFPFLGISLYTFRKNMNGVTEEAVNNAYQATKGIRDDVTGLLEDISECSKFLYEYDNDDYGYFYEIMTNEGISDILKENLVEDALKRILYRNDFIDHVYFIGSEDAVYSTTRAPEKIVNQKEMARWREKTFIPVKNFISVLPVHSPDYYLNHAGENVTFARNIMNTKSIQSSSREILGTLYIDVSLDCFKSLIEGDELMDRKQIFISDWKADAPVYSNYGKEEAAADYGKLKKLMDGEDSFCLKGDQMYFIGYRMEEPDWAVVEKLPYSNLEKTYDSIKKSTVYLVAVSFILLGFLYYFNSRTTGKPIRALKDAMDQIKAGNLSVRADIKSNDELGVLAEGLNNMAVQLQKHIETVYVSEIRQKEAQLKALTAQIQPHYLYNTLDSIRMSAITNDDRDTALMLESLSAQMRYLIGDRRSLVSLKEELHSIQNYFTIIKLRYENCVKLEIHGEEEALKCMVPRLTLQPIIENSVKYGIGPNGEGTIAVFTEIREDCLEITVIDDGAGMDEGTLAHVRRILKGEIREEEGEKKLSIGLRNVEDRVKLQFGTDYGIEISSTTGLGTLVRCRLPVLYERQEKECFQ